MPRGGKVMLGLGYKPSQGKSTVADRLVERASLTGLRFLRFSYSNLIIADLISDGLLPSGSRRETLDRDGLAMLQDRGLGRRKKDENFWVSKFLEVVSEEKDARLCVVENVRFPNEIQALGRVEGWKGYSVLVTRRLPGGEIFKQPGRNYAHAVETALDRFSDWDFKIDNSREMLWLHHQVDALYDYLRCRGDLC